MLAFVIAIGFLCFQTSIAQRIITTVPAAIVVGLAIWEIYTHWQSPGQKVYWNKE